MTRHDHFSGDAIEKLSGVTKIIGIGQSLRGDDGAGLAAVRLWCETYQTNSDRQEIIAQSIELPGLDLLELLKNTHMVILVDAVRTGAPPGTLHTIAENQLEAFDLSARSAHGWGVAETLALGREITPSEMPKKLILLGIEASHMDIAAQVSPEVAQALPRAASLIEQIVRDAIDETHLQSGSPRTSPK